MPSIHWIGKEKVLKHHLDVNYRVLEHQYHFNDGVIENTTDHNGNRIIHGDNLEALKSLLPEYEGAIKCIYIDPPYNTGNEGWTYNDNVSDPKIEKWLGKVVGKEAEDLTRHDKWLCMMYPRLVLLHKLLAEEGVIFISIDDNELANLKLVMDEIFGPANFIEYFSWHKTYSPSNLSYKSKKCLDYILCYEKRRNNRRYKGLEKVNDADNPIIKSNNQVKTLRFPKEAITSTLSGEHVFEPGIYGTKVNQVILKNAVRLKEGKFEDDLLLESKFIWTQENLEREISNNTRIIFKGKSLAPRYDKQSYEPEVPRNLIDYEDEVGTTEEGGTILKEIFGEKLFDYPKTPTLIEYLVNFVTGKNDIVLDSFAGSGTTAHAVLNLNRRDGGNRRFILIEMEAYAADITAERVKRVISGFGKTPGTGGSFDYYELGDRLFNEDGDINEQIGTDKLRQYVFYAETRSYLKEHEHKDNSSFLGLFNGTAYYFFYEPGTATTLNHHFLSTIRTKAFQYVIYADNCLLSTDFLKEHNIIFKKMPRDLNRF